VTLRRGSPSFVLARHSAYLTGRSVRTFLRQPAYAAITLVQPIIWLLLFGQLFRSVVHIPGFDEGSDNYLEFLTPGVVMMTALFSSGWAGTIYIEDMNRGVMDRLLASPVRRGAMMASTLAYQGLTTILQTLIVFAIAFAVGARFPGGAVGGADHARGGDLHFGHHRVDVERRGAPRPVAGGADRHQPIHRAATAFLSSAIMDTSLAPEWIQRIARYNPVDWAVVASREALSASADWGAVVASHGWPGAAVAGDGLARHPRLRQLPEIDLTQPVFPVLPESGASTLSAKRCRPSSASLLRCHGRTSSRVTPASAYCCTSSTDEISALSVISMGVVRPALSASARSVAREAGNCSSV